MDAAVPEYMTMRTGGLHRCIQTSLLSPVSQKVRAEKDRHVETKARARERARGSERGSERGCRLLPRCFAPCPLDASRSAGNGRIAPDTQFIETETRRQRSPGAA
eukprot:3921156-Pleurochrysis_carterae.AAC.2